MATSRSRRLQPLDLDEVGVDDARQVDLVEVHLLGQDQLQEQVERAFVDGGRHIDRHDRHRTLLRRGHRRRGRTPVAGDRNRAGPGRPAGSLPGVTRVLSCIQPTGDVHLGNYLGALRQLGRGQHDKDVFHGIVDLHALTVTEEPGVVGAAHARAGGDVLRASVSTPTSPRCSCRATSPSTPSWPG